MTLRLTNTATRKKEPPPHTGKQVKLYTCGPTVYHYAHIGNFRTYVFEDLLRRTLKYFGYDVEQAMNLTDVDDKTIKGAIEKGLSLDAFTKPYIDAFFEDIDALGIERVEHYPRATEYIEEMIALIQNLLDREVAYKGEGGSVYFSIDRFPNYGCLSHLKLEDLKQGASQRVSSDEYEKDSASDFVLWKAYDQERDGDIFWESPFGKGRPGWHIECSAMAMSLLGKTIDIHVGGVDNMFPHHENEIAQSEAATKQCFSRHWMHSEHLIVEGKKMSKSLGNFYTLRDLFSKEFTGRQVRYMLLMTHYKTKLNFTLEGLQGVKKTLQRIDDFIERLQETSQEGGELLDVEPYRERFSSALADDLNISSALASVFDLIREGNSVMDQKRLSKEGKEALLQFLNRCDEVLNVFFFKQEETIPGHLSEALEKREHARKEKNFALADAIRDEIHQAGFMIEDTSTGIRLKRR